MIATLPALTPTAGEPPAPQRAATEPLTFLAVLDEKSSAPPEIACGSLAPAALFNALAGCTSGTDETNHADETDADAAQALLALLNLTPTAAPDAATAAKTPLTPSTEKARAGAPADAQGVEPLPTAASIIPLPPMPDAPTASAPETGLSAQGIAATDAGGGGLDKLAPLAPPTRAEAAAPSEVKPPASTPAEPQASALKAEMLPLASSAVATKARHLPPSESRFSLAPPAPLTVPPSRAASNAHIQEAGALTEAVGTPAWPPALGQQILCFARNGVQHAELRLHPAELGSLQIRLQLKNEQAQLHFVSESHQVRAAIEAAVPHLRVSLAEAGIELGQSSVGAESSSSWQHPGETPQPRQPLAGQTEPTSPEDRLDITPPPRVYRRGINTFA